MIGAEGLARRLTPAGPLPGALIIGLVAAACDPLAELTGAPAPIIAVILGLVLSCAPGRSGFKAGLELWARPGLKAGVAMLGAQVAWLDLAALGLPVAAAGGVIVLSTVAAGSLFGVSLGLPLVEAVIAAAAVGICGASAAMATASALPETAETRRTTTLVVVGVNLLSTIAMVLYPVLAHALGLSERQTGVFLGLSIHDVAQVAAAGSSVSPETAATAALTKLSRVLWLGPVVCLATFYVTRRAVTAGQGRATSLIPPTFVWAFAALAIARGLGLLPESVLAPLATASHLLLLGGVAAISAQVSPREVLRLQPKLIAALVVTSGFIALASLIAAQLVAVHA